MEKEKPFLTTPVAILIGSCLIAVAIMVSSGSVKIKGYNNTQNTQKAEAEKAANTEPVNAQPAAKTVAEIVSNLKQQAVKLNLNSQKFNSCLDSGEKASLVKVDLDEGGKVGVQGTPSLFINGKPVFKGASPFEEYKVEIEDALAGKIAQADKKEVSVGNLPVLGNTNAPVAIIEFSDYQCPFCAKLNQGALAEIKKNYIDTGKIKLYFRDYPLPFHQGAQKAAEAARCAGDQGKYWQFHDNLFQNQDSIFN